MFDFFANKFYEGKDIFTRRTTSINDKASVQVADACAADLRALKTEFVDDFASAYFGSWALEYTAGAWCGWVATPAFGEDCLLFCDDFVFCRTLFQEKICTQNYPI